MKLLLSILCLLVLFAGSATADYGSYYHDGTGHVIKNGRDARRIVSLAPSVTETLFYLGLGERVIGRTNYCNYPPEAAALPTVGGFADTSLEKIVALKPDLVIAIQGNSLELVTQLRQLGIEVVALREPDTLEEVLRQMQALYWIATPPSHTADRFPERDNGPGQVSLGQLEQRLKQYSHVNEKGPTVFYGMPGEVTYSAAPGSFIDDLITRAGGRNVVPKGKDRWPQVGAEFILAAQPDWLLISTPCTGHTEIGKASTDIRASLAKDPVWSRLKAVQQNHIVVVNADVLLRPGPRLLDALEQLSTAMGGGK